MSWQTIVDSEKRYYLNEKNWLTHLLIYELIESSNRVFVWFNY